MAVVTVGASGHATRSGNQHGEFAHPPMPPGPEELADRRLGTGYPIVGEGREHAQLVVAENLEPNVRLGEFLTNDGLIPPAVVLCGCDQVVELLAETHLLPECRRASLERERAHGHLPAVADTADDKVLVGDGVGEERLVELGPTRDLNDRSDLDTGLVHRYQQIAETSVAFAPRFGASHHEHPVRELGQGGTHLLPVDDPPAVDQLGTGLDVGKVGTSIGLGVSLTPQLCTGQDRWYEALLLLRTSEGHERRPEQCHPHVRDSPRRPGLHIGEVKNDLFGEGTFSSPDCGRKIDAEPASCGQFALPSNLNFGGDVFVPGQTATSIPGEFTGEMLLDPGPDLVRELEQGGVEPDVHLGRIRRT